MRRFSRKRRTGSSGDGGPAPIDAQRWLTRLTEAGVVELDALAPQTHDDVPGSFAALGRGTRGEGEPVWIGFAPRHAGDALLAALATGARLAREESFTGEVLAVCPQWSLAARRRLGLVRAELPFTLSTRSAPALLDGQEGVEAEAALEPTTLTVEQVAAQLGGAKDRALFLRAAAALQGLASKHGGSIRGAAQSVELVILARRVAELRAESGRVTLTTLVPNRSTAVLDRDDLAAALDGLEGQLRRRLNDRRLREGEEGLRARLLPILERAGALRDVIVWPLAGSDREDIDLVGLDADGVPVVAAARETLSLTNLGAILDAFQAMRLATPGLFAAAKAPVQIQSPKLLLAANGFAPGALDALSAFAIAHTLYVVRSDNGLGLEEVGAEEAARSLRDRPQRGRRSGRGRGRKRGGEEEVGADLQSAGAEPEEAVDESGAARAGAEPREQPEEVEQTERAEQSEAREGGRGRSRRRGRRRGRGRDEAGPAAEETAKAADAEEGAPQFEEVSLFDFEEAGAPEPVAREDTGGQRRRGRARGRGRRDAGSDDEARSEAKEATAAASGDADQLDADDLEDDLTDGLADLPEVVPTPIGYSDDDTEEEDETESSAKGRVLERETRRMARRAEKEEVVEPPKPRRRAVVVAHADRDSLLAAVLLARDVRLLEGLWVYDQSDLMNFFREVTTDIKDDVPIYLVGFMPSPARDVIQAAALYRDRLSWYDHHVWPPEDLMALGSAIGEEHIHHTPATGSSLPGMLETCTRRSRFSDKLVDLITGRFTQHDYERWGRLWWWRLGEIAAKRGDVRREIEALLNGRPSDLAKEAVNSETPPIPPEVAYVSERDFRLVHFAGYVMVVAEVEGDFDLHLVGRIARERYSATLSLSYRKGANLFLFGGDEQGGRRVLDFGALAEHLADKLDYVTALPDNDHVARFSVADLAGHPDRLDETIGEIAMGRSILER